MEYPLVWQEALLNSWSQVWVSFLGIIPSVLGAIVVFAVGLLVAFWAKRIIVELLKLIKVESLGLT